MKQKSIFINLLTMMMVAILSTGFAACNSDDDKDDESNDVGTSMQISENQLIGTWKMSVSGEMFSGTFDITFWEDGMYSVGDESAGSEYEIIGNCIIMDMNIMIKVSKCTTNKIMGDYYLWDDDAYYGSNWKENMRDLDRPEWKRYASVTLTRK